MVYDDDKLAPLKTGLSDLLESGLKICCRDGTVYNVHKNILCAQGSFFRNALKPSSNFLTFAPCYGVPQRNDVWEKAATGSFHDDPSNEESPSDSDDG